MNKLSNIEKATFLGLKTLTKLNLINNNLSSIQVDTFEVTMLLETAYLNDNPIVKNFNFMQILNQTYPDIKFLL